MKKKNNSIGGVVALGSAIAGAALGAAAIALSDKKNQEKIKKTVDDISHEAVKIGEKIKAKADEFAKNPKTKKAVKKVVNKVVDKVEKKVEKKAAVKKSPPAAKK